MNQPAKTDEIKPSTPAAQSITPQPVPTTYSTWAHIPIDPALQAQPAPGASQVTQAGQPTPVYQYSPYSYYQSYQNQYAAIPQVTTASTPTPVVAQSSTSTPSVAANSIDTSDINTLRDALGSTGVDLRAEEESLQRTSDSSLTYRSYEDRTRKQPSKPNFNTTYLSNTILQITSAHKLTNPHPSADTVNYLALALRARLQDLITAMITAARHRTDTQFDSAPSMYEDGSPMWSILVRSDVAKQLAALEKVEREEETKIRRERKERADMAAAQAAALAAQSVGSSNGGSGGVEDDQDGFGGGAKKKRKKDGPGVTAKNMSADVQKKMSNAAASHAAGLAGRYAWMTAGASSTPKKPAVAAAIPSTPAISTTSTLGASSLTGGPTLTTTATAATSTIPTASTTGSGWARPYVSATKKATDSPPQETFGEDTRTAITMRDAMFVIEKEKGHGGGRGAAKGWT
ncbi:transcription initiation factor TFIID component TAF4 family-domain-containing protein [Lentinula detonsa]|uniref:Transcription initiation factor TFIID subunit 4 n=1 Tax=Lentinula detonsa TaxID=2804962 RepID=A0A9W8P0N9_9AGAR|nr:transcription initiation factor TFIID component TAF4 family-domain-containing protein [Lentinula detonsa]